MFQYNLFNIIYSTWNKDEVCHWIHIWSDLVRFLVGSKSSKTENQINPSAGVTNLPPVKWFCSMVRAGRLFLSSLEFHSCLYLFLFCTHLILSFSPYPCGLFSSFPFWFLKFAHQCNLLFWSVCCFCRGNCAAVDGITTALFQLCWRVWHAHTEVLLVYNCNVPSCIQK